MRSNPSSVLRRVATLGLAAAIVLLGPACSVKEGPAIPGGGGGPATLIGTEPEHAPIPQKDVPPGQSSLRKTGPDRPLVPPAQP